MTTKPTISEVARKARVAASTVSRVMNGGYASSRTRARVERVIAELGYKPWSVARNFKLGRTGAIGVVVESETIQLEFPTELVVRESSGPAPIRSLR